TATDAANESKECLLSLPSSEEEKPQRVNLLSVNEDFEGKRNTGNLCKRVKHKVYFVVLQRASPNSG
ncbi:MAG: hypothetical protein IJY44_01765, partial [Bacteroidaceae bacterium]|nr:hypothetical protein [Bacteroidaceae bacterium]